MITLLILNNSGDVIYQSTPPKHQSGEGSKIRYLPLLLTKDLFKANFHDRIQYLHTRNKTITFLEKHGLLYIAWSKRGSIPVNLVHQHLFIIDRLLRFHFGPQWHTRVENISATRGTRYYHHRRRHHHHHQHISLGQVSACISKITLISVEKPLYCPDILCSVEQVELHEDLRTRLSQTLRQCCDMAYSFFTLSNNNAAPTASRFTSFFATPPRNVIMPSANGHGHSHRRRPGSFHEGASTIGGMGVGSLMWSDVFLFAKNKIVVRCAKSEMDELTEEVLPHEVLFYLCHMAAEYADQCTVREDLTEKHHILHAPTRSQNILEPSYSADSIHKPVYATSSDSTPTPQASSSEATSQKSSVTYVYDSSSISAPFKVKEKSASSVTVASSSCSTPALSWSSPPPLIHNQLLSRLTRRSGEYHHSSPVLTSSSKLHHHHHPPFIPPKQQQQHPPREEENHHEDEQDEINRRKQKPQPPLQIEIDDVEDKVEEGEEADIEGEDDEEETVEEELPPNAKLYHSSSEHAEDEAANCLSSSLPLESTPFRGSNSGGRRRSSNTSNHTTTTTKRPVLFQSSAPSSPTIRSRSQSNADRLSTKQSLRHMFSSFLQSNDYNNSSHPNSDEDSTTTTLPDNESKVMSRWIKIGHRLVLCLILLIHLGDGLCAAIICRRDHDDSHTIETIRDKMTNQNVARTLRTNLQEHLQDFTTFLLTKEATHFTILSFITAYPGLLHFIHLKDGIMLAPRIVDLSEFNFDHSLLLEIGEKYQEWALSDEDPSSSSTWGWPSITKLHDLCEQMVRKNDQSYNRAQHIVQLDSTAGRGFQCAYQRDKHGDLLMGLYFSFIPENLLLDMHQRLFMDVSRRLP